MTTQQLQENWSCYLDAYSDVPFDERWRLLRQSVTEDVVFTGPNEDGQGFDNLLAHIGDFQEKAPGAYFRSGKLLTQHGQLLSAWTLHKKDGTVIGAGHTYAQFNEQCRLTHVAGFFEV
jgi:hypothetical protein